MLNFVDHVWCLLLLHLALTICVTRSPHLNTLLLHDVLLSPADNGPSTRNTPFFAPSRSFICRFYKFSHAFPHTGFFSKTTILHLSPSFPVRLPLPSTMASRDACHYHQSASHRFPCPTTIKKLLIYLFFGVGNRHLGYVANVLRFLIGDHSGPPLHASLAAKFAARTPALANYAALSEI